MAAIVVVSQNRPKFDNFGNLSRPVYLHRRRRHPHNQRRRKVILFWTAFFTNVDYGLGLGAEPFIVANCEVGNCETTTDRSRLEEADAVIIHPRNVASPLDLPPFKFVMAQCVSDLTSKFSRH